MFFLGDLRKDEIQRFKVSGKGEEALWIHQRYGWPRFLPKLRIQHHSPRSLSTRDHGLWLGPHREWFYWADHHWPRGQIVWPTLAQTRTGSRSFLSPPLSISISTWLFVCYQSALFVYRCCNISTGQFQLSALHFIVICAFVHWMNSKSTLVAFLIFFPVSTHCFIHAL